MRTLNIRSAVLLVGLVAIAPMLGLARALEPRFRQMRQYRPRPYRSGRTRVLGRVLPDTLQAPKYKPARKRNPCKLARRLSKATAW